MKTFTIEQIKNYIITQDSLGDVLYNLSEENIIKANEDVEFNQDEQPYDLLEKRIRELENRVDQMMPYIN